MTLEMTRCVCVVVKFYPWFRFYFPLFQTHYHVIMIIISENKGKVEFKPRKQLTDSDQQLTCLFACTRACLFAWLVCIFVSLLVQWNLALQSPRYYATFLSRQNAHIIIFTYESPVDSANGHILQSQPVLSVTVQLYPLTALTSETLKRSVKGIV